MPFSGALSLGKKGNLQPQGMLQLNSQSHWAPGVAMVMENGPGQAFNYVNRRSLPILGAAPVSLLTKGGRALNSTSTGRYDLALGGQSLNGGFSIVTQFSSTSTNGRVIEFYTTTGKTQISGRIRWSSTLSNAFFEIGRTSSDAQWSTPASSFPSGELHTLALSWDGTFTSGGVTMLVDGAVVTPTFVTGVGSLFGIAHAVMLNRDDGIRALTGSCNFLWLDNGQRTLSELLYLSTNPYACFEGPLPFLGSVVSSGGTTTLTSASQTLTYLPISVTVDAINNLQVSPVLVNYLPSAATVNAKTLLSVAYKTLTYLASTAILDAKSVLSVASAAYIYASQTATIAIHPIVRALTAAYSYLAQTTYLLNTVINPKHIKLGNIAMEQSMRATRPLGYQQITDLTTAKSLTVPVGTVLVVVQAENAAVRYRDDGTAPTATVGYPLALGSELQYAGAFSALQFIQTAPSGILNITYYGH